MADVYMRNPDLTSLTLSLSNDDKKALKKYATEQNMPVSKVIHAWIEAGFPGATTEDDSIREDDGEAMPESAEKRRVGRPKGSTAVRPVLKDASDIDPMKNAKLTLSLRAFRKQKLVNYAYSHGMQITDVVSGWIDQFCDEEQA